MERSDWLTVGLKLLGVYFGVTGLVSLWGTLLGLAVASIRGMPFDGLNMFTVLQPAVYLLAAFFFVWRTRPTRNFLGDHGPDGSAYKAGAPDRGHEAAGIESRPSRGSRGD